VKTDTSLNAHVEQRLGSRSVPPVLDLAPEIIDLLPVAVYACDASGHVLWFNKCAADLWGRAPRIGDDTELFCGSYRLYFNGRQIDRAETPMATVLRSGEAIHGVEAIVERPDGSRIWATVHIDVVKDSAGRVLGAINCFTDTTELHETRAALAERDAQTRRLLEAMPAAVYTTDEAGRITYYNKAAARLAGREPTLGSDEWCVTWKLYWPDGTPLPHDQCPMALALREQRPNSGMEAIAERPDGTRVPFIPYPTPLFDEFGKLTGAVNMLVDISDRKHHEEQQDLLLKEMDHRIKNLFAVVAGMVTLTARSAATPKEMAAAVQGRLGALASAHQLVRQNRSAEAARQQTTLDELVRAILSPHIEPARTEGDLRVAIDGPEISLGVDAATSLALVIHELATNAVKYGAFSVPSGRVRVSWAEANGRLALSWDEAGGPPIEAAPEREGFGSVLARRSAKGQLGGDLFFHWNPAGLAVHLSAATERLAH
jgi:PAS domain S-box-containing protein